MWQCKWLNLVASTLLFVVIASCSSCALNKTVAPLLIISCTERGSVVNRQSSSVASYWEMLLLPKFAHPIFCQHLPIPFFPRQQRPCFSSVWKNIHWQFELHRYLMGSSWPCNTIAVSEAQLLVSTELIVWQLWNLIKLYASSLVVLTIFYLWLIFLLVSDLIYITKSMIHFWCKWRCWCLCKSLLHRSAIPYANPASNSAPLRFHTDHGCDDSCFPFFAF